MEKLTVEELEEMVPRHRFRWGVGPMVVNDTIANVAWVAVRGNMTDWAIYHSYTSNFAQRDSIQDPGDDVARVRFGVIAIRGQKLHDPEIIQLCVPCTDEAFDYYRK